MSKVKDVLFGLSILANLAFSCVLCQHINSMDKKIHNAVTVIMQNEDVQTSYIIRNGKLLAIHDQILVDIIKSFQPTPAKPPVNKDNIIRIVPEDITNI